VRIEADSNRISIALSITTSLSEKITLSVESVCYFIIDINASASAAIFLKVPILVLNLSR
jgi:hypothetical protein